MKINLNGKEYNLLMSSLAVETIEDKYDKAIDEIFTKENKLRSKDVNFILYSALQFEDGEEELTLEQFKKYLSKQNSFSDAVKMLNELLDVDPNLAGETDTETA